MKWKAIGKSVIGVSHMAKESGCEDALQYDIINDDFDEEKLICCVSDGAGSAKYAAAAAEFVTEKIVEALAIHSLNPELQEKNIYKIVEDVYAGLSIIADLHGADLEEYSCTLLACLMMNGKAIFIQIGDGAIIMGNGKGHYVPVWMPHNGEYQNTTAFLTDDPNLAQMKVLILHEQINEVAMFTDGLQMLALNMEQQEVHQPFFKDIFKYLTKADIPEKIEILNNKLSEYLQSEIINNRTDDDKTLFLATRLNA